MTIAETPDSLDAAIAGIDNLELVLPAGPSTLGRVWSAAWPKAAAVVVALVLWQLVTWSGWKPTYLLPGPSTTLHQVWVDRGVIGSGIATTLRRAVEYYLLALVLGTVIAVVVTRSQIVRNAVGPLLTGLQTMPNVAWVPFAILVFGLKAEAILFVALLGTAPAIAIGTVSAIDAVPPVLRRAGTVLGAHGVGAYRHVVLPAALPGYVAGMRQGWAFAWRSLMAGELIVNVAGTHSLGQLLSAYQEGSEAADVLAIMLMILAAGLLVDALVFSRIERTVLIRRGLGG